MAKTKKKESQWATATNERLAEAGFRRGGARAAVVSLLDEQSCALSAYEIEDLLAARERAGLTLDELAAAVLANAGLGADKAEQAKAADYLGQLEQGTLPRLTGRVRDAVRSVLGTDPASSFARPEYGFAFRLSARDDVASDESIERAELLLDAMSTPSPRGWDEVDELFLSDD